MKLQEITVGQSLSGIETSRIVSVVATVPHGAGVLQLIYRTPEGAIKERLLSQEDEVSVETTTTEHPFTFDGDGANFQLTCEAKRIDLAFSLRSHDGCAQLERRAATSSDCSCLRIPVAAPATALCPGGRSGCGQDHHGWALHPRADHARRCAPHRNRRPQQSRRAVARRAVREIRAGILHLLSTAGADLTER